jgi:hypothetical protein
MNKIISTLALVALAAAPALAMQQPAARPGGAPRGPVIPHTVHTELMLFHDANYNGEAETVETPSSRVHTDWPIRSIAVHPGDSWQICARPRFRQCITLNRSVPDASLIGVDNQIGSARLAPAAPASAPAGAAPSN